MLGAELPTSHKNKCHADGSLPLQQNVPAGFSIDSRNKIKDNSKFKN